MKTHSKEKIQLVNELHKPMRKNYARRRTIIKGLDDLWQMDLADMRQYAHYNKNFKMIMVVIDCFSKFMWTRPLKTKTGEEITTAFNDILACGRICVNLQTDQGTEFFNQKFQHFLKKHEINHYNTYSVKKAAIAERAIRTLKSKLYKYFSLNGTYKWIDVLPEITKSYNETRHRTTGYKPAQVNKTNEERILKSAYNHIKISSLQKFKVGDVVRISKNKHVFDKGYTPNWTTELFKITSVKITNPTTYLLEDMQGNPIRGAFYTEELQKTTNPDIYLVEKVLRRKGGKVFVKWLGLDKKHNSWIENTNVI
jgi:Integrase core domain.